MKAKMKAATSTAALLLILSATPALALPDEPPFIRTGQDLMDRCALKTVEDALVCSGMFDVLADQTEKARWDDPKKWCPPLVEPPTVGGNGVPRSVERMMAAARNHPDWLSLPAVTFVDKIEREHRCHTK